MMRMEAIRRRSIMGEKKANYTVLSYIRGSGEQYINTGVLGGSDVIVELDFLPVFSTGSLGFFGSLAGIIHFQQYHLAILQITQG